MHRVSLLLAVCLALLAGSTASAQELVAAGDCPALTVLADEFAERCGTATEPPGPSGSSMGGGWTTVAPLNTARSRTGVAFLAATGKFYVAAGEATGGNRANPIEEYDPVANTWTNRALLITGVSNTGPAAVGNYIYVPGGSTATASVADMQRFDPVANTVTAMAPMPGINTGHAVVARGTFIHVLGGNTTAIAGTTHYIYNTATDTWATGAPVPYSTQFPGAASDGTSVYVFGGNTTNVATAHRYNPATNTWTALPNLTTGRGGPAGYYDGQYIWAINGGWTTYLTSTEYYNGTAWVAGPSTNTGVRTVGAAYGLGIALKAGGWNGTYSAVAERNGTVVTPGTEAPPRIAGEFALGSVAPNPVAGAAHVVVDLERAQTLCADLLDVLGRRVATLQDGAAAAGRMTLTLDTADLPNGVYVLRVAGERGALSTRLTVAH